MAVQEVLMIKFTHVSKKKSKYVFRKCDLPDRFGSCEYCDMKCYNFHRLVYTCVSLNLSVAKREELHALFWFQNGSDYASLIGGTNGQCLTQIRVQHLVLG